MYSVLDIETTGSHSHRHSITEIAIINFDGKEISDQFITLVQPDTSIPYFISHFTGITNDMVASAPPWDDVMDIIDEYTRDRIIVAHNVHFDYSFLKSAYLQSGRSFSRKTLCTLRLARQLLPGLQSYSLNQLCRHLSIDPLPVHRAESDAKAALALFQLLQQKDVEGIIPASLRKRINDYNLPPNLPKKSISSLPETPGVYYFIDKDHKILYVGKARNLRKRVIQHFISNSSTRARTKLMNAIHEIQYEACGNEFIAILKESAEIKKHFPPFNVIQKIADTNFGLYYYEDGNGYLRFAFKKLQGCDHPMIAFASLQEGIIFLKEKQKEFQLCPRLSGLQRTRHECFDHTAGLCDGACIGVITAPEYNERMEEALTAIQAESMSCAIVGDGRTDDEESVVILENGIYLGFGFRKKSLGDSFDLLTECIQHQKDNREVQLLIRSYLQNHSDYRIIMK